MPRTSDQRTKRRRPRAPADGLTHEERQSRERQGARGYQPVALRTEVRCLGPGTKFEDGCTRTFRSTNPKLRRLCPTCAQVVERISGGGNYD